MWQAAAAMGGMALVGALAGSQRQGGGTTETVRNVGPESALAGQANRLSTEQLSQLQSMVNAGAGGQDVQSGAASQRSLADMLGQYSQGGYLPTEADQANAYQFTQAMFAPEQLAMQNRFADMSVQSQRQAARMGRSAMDPILQNKLYAAQAGQQEALSARMQQSYMQEARNMPLQRLQFAQQQSQTLQGLASQAMANRQMLLGLGSNIMQQDMNFRAGVAGTSTTAPQTGGGLAGAIAGGIAGVGAGANAYSAFSGGGSKSSVSGGTTGGTPPLESGISSRQTANAGSW